MKQHFLHVVISLLLSTFSSTISIIIVRFSHIHLQIGVCQPQSLDYGTSTIERPPLIINFLSLFLILSSNSHLLCKPTHFFIIDGLRIPSLSIYLNKHIFFVSYSTFFRSHPAHRLSVSYVITPLSLFLIHTQLTSTTEFTCRTR